MTIAQRLRDVREGFERPFWVANVSEVFERLSYYAAFASLTRYLNESLGLSAQQSTTLSGLFGGWVWFLAAFGGAVADKMGFRRALSLAYLILSVSYFLIGSLGAPSLGPIRQSTSFVVIVGFVLMLPALGVALVKPCVVGTTARASKENVRSLGYSIYYTLVNIGSAGGPLVASWVHRNMSVENVYRVAAGSVFLMFFAVLILFKEPRKPGDAPPPTLAESGRNFITVVTNPKFMTFLLIFSGFWVVYWQEFITLPLYVVRYIDPKADTEGILVWGPVTVICLTVLISLVTAKVASLKAVTLGTLISSLSWIVLIFMPSVRGAILTLVVLALGEIVLSPRYYEYISRLAPPGQQGTYMGFAFLPIGIGSLIGGPFGGFLIHYFGEVKHQPVGMLWTIVGLGVLVAVGLWVYDKMLPTKAAEANAGA